MDNVTFVTVQPNN